MCCRQPNYGSHQRKIMNQQIATIKDSGLNTDYEGVWDFLLLIVAKSHQENYTDIGSFVWTL